MALTDRELLAKTLQAEAGNQGIGGMLAVGSVIRNRMAQGGSLSDVILAPAQFSAWNKVTGAVGGEQGQDMAALKPSEDAYAAADAILSGNAPDITGGATHYYNPSISNPAWGKEKAGGDWTKIGAHIFGKAGDFRTGAAKMNGEQTQKPQGLLSGLLGGQGIGSALGLSPEFSDKLAMAIMAGTGDARLQPLIAQRAAGMKERKAEAKLEKGINKTVDWLKSKNREDLVGAVMTGVIDPASAIQAALAKPKEKTYQYQSLVKDLMAANPNLSYKDALDMALSQTKSGTTVNVGPTGIDYGKPPNNMAWRRDSAGNVMTDERGAPIAVPISGTELAEKLSAAEKAEEKAASAKEVAQTTVSRSVKDALAIMDNKGLSDIFPEAGTVGKFLADYTWNQDARNLRRTLQSLQANTAFTRLQEMRDASKTGGALGNVSNVELELLMSSYGSLSQDLSPDMLRTNLKNIEKVMGKIEEDPVARAFYEDGVDLRGSEVDAQVKAGNGSNTVIEYDAQGNRIR